MKSISLEQFEELLALGGWRHTQIVNDTGSDTREEYRSGSDAENPECIASTVIFGDAVMTSVRDGVTVTYSESWSYVKHNEDSFSHGEDNGDGVDSVWTVTGVDVINDGEIMNETAKFRAYELYHSGNGKITSGPVFESEIKKPLQ